MEGIEVRVSDSKKGKGLFATKQFNEGDIILEEDPLVSCQFAWNAAYRYLACDYCMRPLETPEQNVRRLSNKPALTLPYPDCVDSRLDQMVGCDECAVIYCSEECRQNALNKYHRLLCYNLADAQHPITTLLDTWKQMHYPPESTNVMLLVRALAAVTQDADTSTAAQQLKQFCHRSTNEDAQLVHKLLGEQFSSQISTLREMTSRVIYSEHIQEFLTPEGFISLLALVGCNGQGVGTSPLSQWAERVLDRTQTEEERDRVDKYIDTVYQYVQEESGTFLNTEGSALYVVQSAANHSCQPNAEGTFPFGNHRIQLRALKSISAGDEIFISYLDECALQRSRHSRQKELSENYLFICECERCLSQICDDDVTSDDVDDNDEDDDDSLPDEND